MGSQCNPFCPLPGAFQGGLGTHPDTVRCEVMQHTLTRCGVRSCSTPSPDAVEGDAAHIQGRHDVAEVVPHEHIVRGFNGYVGPTA